MPRASTASSDNGQKAVKHVAVKISTINDPERGFYTYPALDKHLTENYLSKGWKLFSDETLKVRSATEMGGGTSDVVERMYLLVRYAD